MPSPALLEGLQSELPERTAADAARRVLEGGLWLWRAPTRAHPAAAAALAAAAVSAGRQALILIPEVEMMGPVVEQIRRVLPKSASVATYHAGMGRARSALYGAAAAGRLDVLVGTRSAALLPLGRPGRCCASWTSPTRHTGPSPATRGSRCTSGRSPCCAPRRRAAAHCFCPAAPLSRSTGARGV